MWPVEGGKTPDVAVYGRCSAPDIWTFLHPEGCSLGHGRRVSTASLARKLDGWNIAFPFGCLPTFRGFCCSFQGGWTKTTQQNYNQSSEYTVKLGFMNVIQISVIQIYPNLRPFVISDQKENQLRLRALEGSSPTNGDVLFPPWRFARFMSTP